MLPFSVIDKLSIRPGVFPLGPCLSSSRDFPNHLCPVAERTREGASKNRCQHRSCNMAGQHSWATSRQLCAQPKACCKCFDVVLWLPSESLFVTLVVTYLSFESNVRHVSLLACWSHVLDPGAVVLARSKKKRLHQLEDLNLCTQRVIRNKAVTLIITFERTALTTRPN